MTTLSTPNGIEYARLAACKSMVKLELIGMKHSSGRSVTAAMRREFGLARNASHAAVIGCIVKRMVELLDAERDNAP